MTYNAPDFWSNVQVGGVADCWPWTAPGDTGYGRYRGQFSHRLALHLSGVPVTSQLDVNHACENKACCNPMHLQVMKHSDHSRVTRGQQSGSVRGI